MFKEGTYLNRPTISLFDSLEAERFAFTFGIAKAKLILANLKAIEEFVAKHESKEAA